MGEFPGGEFPDAVPRGGAGWPCAPRGQFALAKRRALPHVTAVHSRSPYLKITIPGNLGHLTIGEPD